MTVTTLIAFFRESITPYIKDIYTDMQTRVLKLTGYSKLANGTAVADVVATDTVNEAFAKVENTLSTKANADETPTNIDLTNAVSILSDSTDEKLLLKADLVNGKVKADQLPDSILGGLNYQGGWDASTVAPASTTKGWYYIVTADGSTDLSGITDWKVGDWAVWDGAAWEKVDNTEPVKVTGDTLSGPFTVVTQVEADADIQVVKDTM